MSPIPPESTPPSSQISDGSFYPLGRADASGTFAESYGSGTTMSLPPLDGGTLLKGGRYRLLQRFGAPPANTSLGQPEAPLWEASDAEQPGGRVLVQELPLSLLAPERADALLRQVIVRVELAGQAPGLPRMVDAFAERRRRFVVFALPEGERLSELLRGRGAMPEVEVVRLGTRLADLLERMERMTPPMVHGNVATDNIFMRPDGTITLAGYSPTLLVQGAGGGEQGSAGGARGYAAPEQMGGLADTRADIFGAGAVLYFAATRFDPSSVEGKGLPPVRKVNGAVSRGMEAVLARALQPNVNQRFQSPFELRQQLSGLVALEDLPAGSANGASAGYAGPATAPGAAGQLQGPSQRYAPLTGAVGALRASLEGELPPALAAELEQQGKKTLKRAQRQAKRTKVPRPAPKRRHRPVVLLALIVLVLAGLAADGYFYATTQLHLKLSEYLPVLTAHLLALAGR